MTEYGKVKKNTKLSVNIYLRIISDTLFIEYQGRGCSPTSSQVFYASSLWLPKIDPIMGSLVERSLPSPHSPRVTEEERGVVFLLPLVTSGQVFNPSGPCVLALHISSYRNFPDFFIYEVLLHVSLSLHTTEEGDSAHQNVCNLLYCGFC